MITQCSKALLEAALSDELPPDEEASLLKHLAECPACDRAMEELAGGTAWTQELASALAADELDAEVPSREEWSVVDFTVEHLEPSDEPNVLGKLGSYDILEVIGRGGMGIVLKGYDRQLKRCVAIKVLAPHLAQSSLAKKRFAREAQAAAAVVHPNVLAIHQVSPSGRLPFLVMPLVAGESLAHRLTAKGTLELIEILRIGMQAAAGLAAAHEQGLVHRDVKPANILLEKGVERAVLTDFGLARAADDVAMTRWGVIAGTPQYMSPEQARGEALDGRSDLFSLGCVLYEMATGVSPFRTDSTMATLRRLIDDPPQAMASLNPELPPWFIAIVEKLLEKDPTKRFSSAKEVSDRLEGCLAHVQRPGNVPLPAGLPVPKAQTARKRALRWITAVAVIIALGYRGGAAFMTATEPYDIAGNWTGEDWGNIVLTQTAEGEYAGTYSDTFKTPPSDVQRNSAIRTSDFLKRKLQTRTEEEKRTLIRRLYLDLTGLPPTIEEEKAFITNDDPQAYETLVDKILATGNERYRVDTQSDFANKQDLPARGRIHLRWSRIERQYTGTWSEGEDRFGDLSVRLVGNEIRGAWTTSRKSKINPATPKLADLTWIRSQSSGFDPVIERNLSANEFLSNSFLDLDTGNVLSASKELLDEISGDGKFPTGSPHTAKVRDWMRANGADVLVRTSPGPGKPPAPAFVTQVDGLGPSIGEKKASPGGFTFDTVTIDILKQWLSESEKVFSERKPDEMQWGYHLSGVYAFKTREGRVGILELVSVSPNSATLRYKFLNNSDRPAAANCPVLNETSQTSSHPHITTRRCTACHPGHDAVNGLDLRSGIASPRASNSAESPESKSQEFLSFGPVIEKTFNEISVGKDCFLNLERGELLTPPDDVREYTQMRWWAEKNDADVAAFGNANTEEFELRIFGGLVVPPSDGANKSWPVASWDATPEVVADTVHRYELSLGISRGGPLPVLADRPCTAFNEPSDQDVIRAMEVEHPQRASSAVRIVKEKILDYVDPPREYPLIGQAQMHHARYKCTIHFAAAARVGQASPPQRSGQESAEVIVHIDRDHMHRLPEEPERIAVMPSVPLQTPCFFIQTRNGTLGILQILQYTQNRPAVKIRYKLIRKHEEATRVPLHSSDQPRGALSFSKPIEANIHAVPMNKISTGLCLKNGYVVEIPERFRTESAQDDQALKKERSEWLASIKMNFYIDFHQEKGGVQWSFHYLNVKLAEVPNEAWDTFTATALDEHFAKPGWQSPGRDSGENKSAPTPDSAQKELKFLHDWMPQGDSGSVVLSDPYAHSLYFIVEKKQTPLTFAFETKEGSRGIAQLTFCRTDATMGVRFQYKLLQYGPNKDLATITGSRKILLTIDQALRIVASLRTRKSFEEEPSDVWALSDGFQVPQPGVDRYKLDIEGSPRKPHIRLIHNRQKSYYYIKWNPSATGGSSYYGPFNGDPFQVYGLAQPSDDKASATPNLQFEPEQNLVISAKAVDEDGFAFVDFESGKSLKPPSKLKFAPSSGVLERDSSLDQWIKETNVNMLIRLGSDDWDGIDVDMHHYDFDMQFFRKADLNEITVQEALGDLLGRELVPSGFYGKVQFAKRQPYTGVDYLEAAVFRTEARRMGVFRVKGTIDGKQKSVTINYRLVKQAEAAKPKTTEATTDDRETTKPLANSIAEFNQEAARIDKDQPPLTEDEVISSIRGLIESLPKDARFTAEEMEQLKRIVADRTMPVGWNFGRVGTIDGADGERLQTWMIYLYKPDTDDSGKRCKNLLHVIRQQLLGQLDADGKPMPLPDVKKELIDADAVPLAAAIAEFNATHHILCDVRQPPLTEEEVVAAIRWWKTRRNEALVTNGEFAAFQKIADTRQLPDGVHLEVISDFVDADGNHDYIWSVRIVMPRESKKGWTYAYEIRKQHLRSERTEDLGISWGATAKNGLQVGVRIEPRKESYAIGEQVTPIFYYRNSGRGMPFSFPRLMTRGYYSKLIAVDAAGKDIPIEQTKDAALPVGWIETGLQPSALQEIPGPPMVLGNVERGSAETAIHAEPGQTFNLSFQLPNYSDENSEPLQTGNFVFVMDPKLADSNGVRPKPELPAKATTIDPDKAARFYDEGSL
jgi:hypothetical protein